MRKKTIIGLLLLVFCLACRYSTPVADFYAEHCYPLISTVLSRISSIVRFSLEEIVVLAFVVTFVDILVKALWKKEGFFKWLGKTSVVIMWLYVWSYMGCWATPGSSTERQHRQASLTGINSSRKSGSAMPPG